MATTYSPKIVTDGLILLLDAANPKSYPGTGIDFFDLSGYINHHSISNTPTFSNGQFTLNGVNQGFFRPNTLNGISATGTVVIWYSTTDVQELWVKGNQNNSFYLSASDNNTYYHANLGNNVITNLIDLNPVSNPTSAGYKDGKFHMWEAKNVNFTTWNYFEWFGYYEGGWQMAGNVSTIMVYNKVLTPTESEINYKTLKSRFGL